MKKNQQKNVKEKQEKEEIALRKTLEMSDKLKMYCLRKGFPDAHPQVPSIRNSITNFTTPNLQQS